MRLRVIVACLLLLAIPAAGLWGRAAVCARCGAVLDHIDAAIKRGETFLPEEVDAAIALWRESETLLTSFVTHEEVDEALTSLLSARALGLSGGTEEYCAALQEARQRVLIVRDFDRPTLRSIF